MIKFITSPQEMRLSDVETAQYDQIVDYVTEISLNLMAVKVTNRPEDFLGWCNELYNYVRYGINMDLLDAKHEKPLQKLLQLLEASITCRQVKTSRITPWPFLKNFILDQAERQALPERLRLLNYISTLRLSTLADMSDVERLAFAGKHLSAHEPAKFDFDVELFGSTRGAKGFHELLQHTPSLLDDALSAIPAEGDVSEADYKEFVKRYIAAFSTLDKAKAGLFAATRLLAMRRPDVFMVLTATKVDALCQGLGLVKLKATDFSRYWVDVIEGLHRQPWFKSAQPEDATELELWNNRVVLFDLFFFVDKDFANKSNYLKLKNKPVAVRSSTGGRTRATGAVRQKRTKESATEAVDRLLAEADLPSYLQSKRDSMIVEVEKGKSATEVMQLIRAIFG
ncbi:hypothetical protein [Moritella sp. Urea-trap-13]|uniref:hypothetical protein n=1 Tax=Moritella sp. Urea-trap-13 TaxID=2058327 RepID=UPI000C31BB75|nr:hypothetical protein [Moritella sp. Urea-trap-13]PKH04600.1 hypothetical protein CXF93_20500 [Moritella sp. Urea-trap-13]